MQEEQPRIDELKVSVGTKEGSDRVDRSHIIVNHKTPLAAGNSSHVGRGREREEI